jgi:acyl-[acyl-carrier-protein]-phospholipid O-acyltransferase/long-chain-fatty-acid--[acyl-carrier-protein] ligase
VTDHAGATREAFQAHSRAQGLPELFLPRQILAVDRMPLLGSGKFDYPAISKIALETVQPVPV